jgi:hypothetical protein
MSNNQVHFEVFARRKSTSNWTLELATEDRAGALKAAEEMMTQGRAVAVKVTKETLDQETREFKTVSIFNKGEPERKKDKAPRENLDPLCTSPNDLYSGHARERIGRLLEGFLARNRVTPFELMHRPDLVERLEAAGMDLQHAIQKVAIPEAAARGIGVHELIRGFQRLAEAAIERVLRDGKKGVFPNLAKESFAAAAERLEKDPERQYRLGGAVAASIGQGGGSWKDKVSRLLDLADAAPQSPSARALAFQVLELPLAEILGSRAGVADLLGADLDLGGLLAGLTRLAAADSVEALAGIEPTVAKVMPPLDSVAARLANWLEGPYFASVRTAIFRRVMQDLAGPRRLRPNDAKAEIDILRALAMSLTAAAGRSLSAEEVQEAFIARSQLLVRSDFVEAYLGAMRKPAMQEVRALMWLAENVLGTANKRQAHRWIVSNITALRFETEVRNAHGTPMAKLADLAALQRSVINIGASPEDSAPIVTRIGEVGGMVEADTQLVATVARTGGPPVNRLTLLLRLACGDAAPLGPAADRARAEATRMMRQQETRAALAEAPDALERVLALAQTAGMAA